MEVCTVVLDSELEIHEEKSVVSSQLSVVLVFVFGLWPLAYFRVGMPSKDFPYLISHLPFTALVPLRNENRRMKNGASG